MLSRWEKVSGAIIEPPTLGSTAGAASGKSAHKKAACRYAGGESDQTGGESDESAGEPLLVVLAHHRHGLELAVDR